MADRKVKQQKEIEQLSPEALEKEIENNKRKIVQSIVFIAAAAIALIAICMAWFVSNSRVNGTLVTVSAKYSGIEIGSEGIAGVHDDFLVDQGDRSAGLLSGAAGSIHVPSGTHSQM